MNKQKIINFWKKLEISENDILEILKKITGLNSSQLFLSFEIEDKFLEEIESYFMRVVSWEPIEYIIEKAEFYWFDFFVDSRTLIPRNDTEVMVDQVLKNISENTILIDVWTGSSCIPISILKSLNKNDEKRILKTYVVDISKEALEVSKINIEKYWFKNKIEQICWDLLSNFSILPLSGTSFEKGRKLINNLIITANLPYIKNWDFENIDPETVEFEPDLALYWWKKTGFELYEKLITQIIEMKKSILLGGDLEGGIVLFIEIWFDQKKVCEDFLNKLNLKSEIFKDNGWIDRCVKIYF